MDLFKRPTANLLTDVCLVAVIADDRRYYGTLAELMHRTPATKQELRGYLRHALALARDVKGFNNLQAQIYHAQALVRDDSPHAEREIIAAIDLARMQYDLPAEALLWRALHFYGARELFEVESHLDLEGLFPEYFGADA